VSQPKLDDDLLRAFKAGDDAAGEALFERYFDRLTRLVRSKMGWRLKRVEGSSDVAQSVMRTVFRRSRSDADIHTDAEGSLWPLLAAIAVNKLCNRAKYWQRQRRDQRREVALDETFDSLERGPTPEDVAELEDLIEHLLEPFPERRRRILQLVLQDRPTQEIAEAVQVSQRTVYATRQAAGELLTRLLAKD